MSYERIDEANINKKTKLFAERMKFLLNNVQDLKEDFGQYVLEGKMPFKLDRHSPVVLAGCFYSPTRDDRELKIARYRYEPLYGPLTPTYSRILGIQIPMDGRELGIGTDNTDLRKEMEIKATLVHLLPSIMLVLGKTNTDKEDATVLFAVAGISAVTGLKDMQDLVREYKINEN